MEPYNFTGDTFFSTLKFNWLEQAPGCVTAVRDQENVAACYAFPSVDCVFSEYSLFGRHRSKLKALAPQEIIDCLPQMFPPTNVERWNQLICDPSVSGYPSTINKAFEYIQRHGICSETRYPYLGVKQQCRRPEGVTHKVFITGYDNLGTTDVIARLLKQPVAGSVPFVQSFSWYNGEGVYIGPTAEERLARERAARDGKPLPLHALQIVAFGYEGSRQFYLGKNSWGPTYGHNGFVKISSELLDRVSYPYGAHIKRVQN